MVRGQSKLIGSDQSGALVGAGDVGEQSRCLFENLGRVLAAAGSKPDDVARVTVYMRDITERAKMNAARKDFFGDHRPASTLIGVSALVEPEVLVEVDAVAVLQR
ncbi:MAG TPA: RidA family protein [Candidatus Dormibacteraeota bacterium]|nr:RidA family protein [Candidatus Dormibacteraeota bacterium]